MANSKAFHSDLKFVCVLPLLRTHVSWYAHPRSVLELLIIIMFNYFGYMYNLFLDSDNFQTLFRPLCKTPLVLTGFQPSGLITSVWSKLQAFWLLLIDFVTLWKDMPRSILCQYPILMSLSSLQEQQRSDWRMLMQLHSLWILVQKKKCPHRHQETSFITVYGIVKATERLQRIWIVHWCLQTQGLLSLD